MHIDTDEANAGLIETGDQGLLVKKHPQPLQTELNPSPTEQSVKCFEGSLLTERAIDRITETVIVVQKGTIITPLAKDRARQ